MELVISTRKGFKMNNAYEELTTYFDTVQRYRFYQLPRWMR